MTEKEEAPFFLERKEENRGHKIMQQRKESPGRGDVRWGREAARLERLANRSGKSKGEIAREALIRYELDQIAFKDTVRDAVLALFQTVIPDEQFDPEEDPRQEKAMQTLGIVLNSNFAAEGIAAAFTLLFNENMLEMSTLRFPSIKNQDDPLFYSEEAAEPEERDHPGDPE